MPGAMPPRSAMPGAMPGGRSRPRPSAEALLEAGHAFWRDASWVEGGIGGIGLSSTGRVARLERLWARTEERAARRVQRGWRAYLRLPLVQAARFLANTPEEQRSAVMLNLASRDLDDLRFVRRDHPSHAALLKAIYRAVCHGTRSPSPCVLGRARTPG